MAASILPQAHDTAGARPMAGASTSVAALADSMASERRLIDALVEVLRQQRRAVADDCLSAIDDSVFTTHRLLATLAEARRRRQTLASLLCQRTSPSIYELESLLGSRCTPGLVAARDELREAASRLASEAALNRAVLNGASAAGDAQIRTLAGQPAGIIAPGALAYGESGAPSHGMTTTPPGGRLLNRTG